MIKALDFDAKHTKYIFFLSDGFVMVYSFILSIGIHAVWHVSGVNRIFFNNNLNTKFQCERIVALIQPKNFCVGNNFFFLSLILLAKSDLLQIVHIYCWLLFFRCSVFYLWFVHDITNKNWIHTFAFIRLPVLVKIPLMRKRGHAVKQPSFWIKSIHCTHANWLLQSTTIYHTAIIFLIMVPLLWRKIRQKLFFAAAAHSHTSIIH